MISKAFLLFSLCLLVNSFNLEAETPLISQEVSDINWPFTTCGDGDWTIQKLTMSQTPKKNTKDSITVTGTANDAIDFNGVTLTVKLNGAFLHDEKDPFSSSYDAGDSVKYVFSNDIPSFAPSGTYSLTLQFMDKKGARNGCLNFTFKL